MYKNFTSPYFLGIYETLRFYVRRNQPESADLFSFS